MNTWKWLVLFLILLAGALVLFFPRNGLELQLPPVHIAARQGDTAKVMELIKSGNDVNALDEQGLSPLYYALIRGHFETAQALIDAGASQTVRTRSSQNLADLFEKMSSQEGEEPRLRNAARAARAWLVERIR